MKIVECGNIRCWKKHRAWITEDKETIYCTECSKPVVIVDHSNEKDYVLSYFAYMDSSFWCELQRRAILNGKVELQQLVF